MAEIPSVVRRDNVVTLIKLTRSRIELSNLIYLTDSASSVHNLFTTCNY